MSYGYAPIDSDLCWYDDEIWNTSGGTSEDHQLAILVNDAVTSIETHPKERARIQGIISDLECVTGNPVNSINYSDLDFYDTALDDDRLKYNICYSVCSTIKSRVCSFRPRAQYIPEAGNYKTNKTSREQTAACDAWAQREKWQKDAAHAFFNGIALGTGVMKYYSEGNKEDGYQVKKMRCPPWEIKIDPDDGKYGEADCIYHVQYIHLNKALRKYGDTADARKAIRSGARRMSEFQGYGDITHRFGRLMCRITDAYSRGPRGAHVIVAGDYIALREEWKHTALPFDFYIGIEKEIGTWGVSVTSMIRTIQDRIDEFLAVADDAHHNSAKLVIELEDNADNPAKVTNDPVLMLKRRPGANPAVFHNPRAMDPSEYEWWNILKAMAFEIIGVPPNAAHGTKAQNVTSGVAIDNVTELEDGRMSGWSQDWEQSIIPAGDWFYMLSEDLADGGGEYSAEMRGSSRLIKLTFGKRKPSIRTFPTSLFGNSIPARLQKAMDAVKAGWFDQEEILKILDVPDIGSITELKLAEYYYIETLLDDVLEEGIYNTPIEWASPIKAFEYGRRRYMLAVSDGSFPKENLAKATKMLRYLQQQAQKSSAGPTAAVNQQAQPSVAPVPPAAPLIPGPTPVATPPLPGLPQSPEATPQLAAPQLQ